MKAKLKSLDMGSHISLDEYQPEKPECFGIWLTAGIGSENSKGRDNFQILVCSQIWLDKQYDLQKTDVDRCIIINEDFSSDQIKRIIRERVEDCEGNDWMDVVTKLSCFGRWEFEGYRT